MNGVLIGGSLRRSEPLRSRNKGENFIAKNKRSIKQKQLGKRENGVEKVALAKSKASVTAQRRSQSTSLKTKPVPSKDASVSDTVVISKKYLDELLSVNQSAFQRPHVRTEGLATADLAVSDPPQRQPVEGFSIEYEPGEIPGLREKPSSHQPPSHHPSSSQPSSNPAARHADKVGDKTEEYYPWGRPGGGAPLRSDSGRLQTDYHRRSNGLSSIRKSCSPVRSRDENQCSPCLHPDGAAVEERVGTRSSHLQLPSAMRCSITFQHGGDDASEKEKKLEERRKWLNELQQQIDNKKSANSNQLHTTDKTPQTESGGHFVSTNKVPITGGPGSSYKSYHAPQFDGHTPQQANQEASYLEVPSQSEPRHASPSHTYGGSHASPSHTYGGSHTSPSHTYGGSHTSPSHTYGGSHASPEGQAGVSPSSYRRGGGPFINEFVLREKEEKRRKEEEHKRMLRLQIEEKERLKHEEAERLELEEKREAEHLARYQAQAQMEFQKEQEKALQKKEDAAKRHAALQQRIIESERASLKFQERDRGSEGDQSQPFETTCTQSVVGHAPSPPQPHLTPKPKMEDQNLLCSSRDESFRCDLRSPSLLLCPEEPKAANSPSLPARGIKKSSNKTGQKRDTTTGKDRDTGSSLKASHHRRSGALGVTVKEGASGRTEKVKRSTGKRGNLKSEKGEIKVQRKGDNYSTSQSTSTVISHRSSSPPVPAVQKRQLMERPLVATSSTEGHQRQTVTSPPLVPAGSKQCSPPAVSTHTYDVRRGMVSPPVPALRNKGTMPASPHPVPSSPHPVPSSPHPIPSSPHPVPSSPHPIPSSPHPIPSSPHPVPTSPLTELPSITTFQQIAEHVSASPPLTKSSVKLPEISTSSSIVNRSDGEANGSCHGNVLSALAGFRKVLQATDDKLLRYLSN